MYCERSFKLIRFHKAAQAFPIWAEVIEGAVDDSHGIALGIVSKVKNED